MDGYAVRTADCAPGTPLTRIGESAAGHPFDMDQYTRLRGIAAREKEISFDEQGHRISQSSVIDTQRRPPLDYQSLQGIEQLKLPENMQ